MTWMKTLKANPQQTVIDMVLFVLKTQEPNMYERSERQTFLAFGTFLSVLKSQKLNMY